MPDRSLARALEACATWPVDHVSAGVLDSSSSITSIGPVDLDYRLASISKVFTSWACLVAVEEGTVSLDDAVGPPGSTLRHCLAHAAGYGFDGRTPVARVGSRRIYSNAGIEVASDHVAARSGIAFADYLVEAVIAPLGLDRTSLRGSPAHGVHSCLSDMLTFVHEVRQPTLISPSTAQEAVHVQFSDLAGMVPGIGSFDPNPWGLGVEIHGDKHPHWMGTLPSADTFGHFGGSGTMFWVDPQANLALVALTDRPFDEWAESARLAWSSLSDAVIAAGTHP